jgi:hypothetical protein
LPLWITPFPVKIPINDSVRRGDSAVYDEMFESMKLSHGEKYLKFNMEKLVCASIGFNWDGYAWMFK